MAAARQRRECSRKGNGFYRDVELDLRVLDEDINLTVTKESSDVYEVERIVEQRKIKVSL